MFCVEVCGAEGHLRLLKDGLLRLSDATDLIIFDEEVPMLGLAVPIDLLLQALIRFAFSHHLVIRVGHTVIAGLPLTLRCGLVKVVLCFADEVINGFL